MTRMGEVAPCLAPQLCMRRSTLEHLPDIVLAPGYSIRTSQPGDGVHWARILRESFRNDAFDEARYERDMLGDPSYRPDRIFFVCTPEGLPCGTASAYRRASHGWEQGYLHYVGVCPAHAGRKLGAAVSLAVLRKFRAEGLSSAILQTDDFRLPAIKTYLDLGFEPLIVDENQPPRWTAVLTALGRPVPARFDTRS